MRFKTVLFSGVLFFLLIIGAPVHGQTDVLGQTTNFFIDSNYDLTQRDKISAVLQKISSGAYFYVDEEWWRSLNQNEKDKINESLASLDKEFNSNIYPTLITAFGLERRPGIDNDTHITILIHPMQEDAGGYFAEKDEQSRLSVTNSNEREMVYLNSKYINSPNEKSFLAHEFTHLITYNQKDEIRGVSEDVWLNEGRADYAPTLCGYDSVYEGSNLQRRVKIFLNNPNDSLTEWQNISQDYGSVGLFIQYLVDHYGVKILSDSLWSSKVGVQSLDYALQKEGFKEDFSQVFTDWTITVLINDCSAGIKYCYLSQNLKNLRIIPQTNIMPRGGKGTLTISDATKNWAGNWYKIIGGEETLNLKFTGSKNIFFKIPYIVKDSNDKYTVSFFELNKSQQGEIFVKNFGMGNNALYLIPTIQNKNSNLSSEPFYSFSWSASVVEVVPQDDPAEIQKLLAIIIDLKQKIAAILAERGSGTGVATCSQINSNLSVGALNNDEVKCLQSFLKSQGMDIYPEGYVTGNFGQMTRSAVVRFQEKYRNEILAPLNLQSGTGIVGPATRQKINQILNGG